MPPPLRTWGDCDQCLSALGGLTISACLPFLGELSPVPLRNSRNYHKCLSALGGNTTTVFVGNEPLRRNACTKAGRGFVKFACAMSNAASALGDALVAPPWQYSAQNNYPAKHRMHNGRRPLCMRCLTQNTGKTRQKFNKPNGPRPPCATFAGRVRFV